MSITTVEADYLHRKVSILAIKKGALVLNTLANTLQSPEAQRETKAIVGALVWAANELEGSNHNAPKS